MKTTVKNLITKEENLFINKQSAKDNIINMIIINNKQTSNLLSIEWRNKISDENNIVSKISANGDNIAFCYELDLFARQKNTKK